jgi:4-amino-4-deoxy-L-arabinose transferase-like glycosyltransferase
MAGPEARNEENTSEPFGGQTDPLIDYLRVRQGDAEYLVAVTKGHIANPIILNTDEPVISLGGFGGRDPVFNSERIAGMVDEGAVRFFLMEKSWQQGSKHKRKVLGWIQDNCEQIPQELWQSSTSEQTEGSREKAVLLYDCGTGAR